MKALASVTKKTISWCSIRGPGVVRDVHVYGGLCLIGVCLGNAGWAIVGGTLVCLGLFYRGQMTK